LLLSASAGCRGLENNLKRSCRRLGQDLLVTAALPAQMLAGSAQDVWATAGDRPLLSVPAAPVVFAFSAYKHTVTSLVYTADIALFPFYAWFGPDSIRIYDTSRFPFGQPEAFLSARKRMGRDAAVTVCMPGLVPAAAGHAAWTMVRPEPVTGSLLLPLAVPLQALRHLQYGLVHTGDLVLYLFYFPFAVEPVEIYNWERLPFEVRPPFNATARRFGQNARIALTSPVMAWSRAARSWKEERGQHPALMGVAAPVYVPAVALYHGYLALCSGLDAASYPVLFWTGWGPFDLYTPEEMRVNPLKAKVVYRVSASGALVVGGAAETTFGLVLLADEEARDDRRAWGSLLFYHGLHTMTQGVAQAAMGTALSDLARSTATGYRCRTAPEILQIATGATPGVAVSDRPYDLGDFDGFQRRVRAEVGSKVAPGPATNKVRAKIREDDVRSWTHATLKAAQVLAQTDEALDKRLVAELRAELLGRTGAIEPLNAGTAAGTEAALRADALDGLLYVYHFPDDAAGCRRVLDNIEHILTMEHEDDAWYERCRRELLRVRNGDYGRTAERCVLRSLMIEGFVWLYESLER
jgi:hypothetical protein